MDLVYRWLSPICRHHPKVTAAAMQLSRASMRDSGEGKSSQCVVYLVVHSAWKEKWQYMCLHTNSWAVANGLAG